MKILMGLVAVGITSTLVLSGCAGKGGGGDARCDHAQPKIIKIKITAGRDKSKVPAVDKKTVVACYQDSIVFNSDVDNFSIEFKSGSPFKQNLNSMHGKAQGLVKANPKSESVKYKYDVVVPGYPVLDPWIRIVPR